MINFKRDSLSKKSPNIKEDHNIKFEKDKNFINIDNKQNIDNLFRKKFPELKLTNLKTRPGTESPDFNRGKKVKTLSIVQNNQKIRSNIPNNRQNNLLMKKKDLNFPKVNSVKKKENKEINGLFKNANNNFPIYNNFSTRWNLKIGLINNNINNDNKTYFNKNINMRNEEIKIKDNITFFNKLKEKKEEDNKIKEGNNSYQKNEILVKNFTLNPQNIKSKIRQIHKNNIQLQKLKILKKNASNILNKDKNAITPNSTIKNNPFQGISSFYNHFQNKIIINNQKRKIKPAISPITNYLNKPNTDRINSMNSIFNILKNYSSSELDGIIPIQNNININSDIFKNKYKNFQKSKISKKEDIKNGDYIKGYGYNRCLGNVRDNNEDEIIITKIDFNNDPDNYCFYFAIFDGHGGNGCSSYLKNNLHKNIKEFSGIGLKIGIDVTEEKFKINEALDENEEIKDKSGSCGIVLMIKGKKCIIANIGNSRLVIFKNNTIDFETMDHKPDSIIEKARIELAGGKIYKPPNLCQEEKIEMPWKVIPGEICVSRSFGDIEAKDENFGGNKTVVICMPDITEINLDDNYNFIAMGSDGIFDVLKNEELLECVNIVLKEKKIKDSINDEDIHKLCGNFTDMIIKSALAKNSFDNLSCIVIGLNLNKLLY